MKKIGWLTDPHFDKCDIDYFYQISKKFKAENLDGLIITGDISEGGTTMLYLSFLEKLISKPIWFVLGNHDWYNVSRDVGFELIKKYSNHNLIFLDDIPFIKLNKTTCLIGGENWWDAFFKQSFGLLDGMYMSEDYEKISFISPEKHESNPFSKIKLLAAIKSDVLIEKLINAFKIFDTVYLAVHVPPFKEGCLFSAIEMPENWLNHFCDHELGIKLKLLMKSYPEKELKILSGHTHSKSTKKIKQNIKQYVGASTLKKPKICDIIKL